MKQARERIFGNAIFILSIMTTAPLISQAAGTSAAQFLTMGAGARAVSMGEAFTATADDVTSTYWNPAGLSQLETPQIGLMNNSWLIDTSYQYLGAAFPMENRAFGFSLYRLDFGEIDRYTRDDKKDGSYDASSIAGSVTFSAKINEGLSYGVSCKLIQESIDNESAQTFAGDFGILFHRGIFNIGATVQNLGPGLQFVDEKAPLPLTMRMGAAADLFDDKAILEIDVSKANDNGVTYHGGLEYKLTSLINLRAGYKITPSNQLDIEGLTGLTGGLGMNFGAFSLDYAIVPFGELDNAHLISLLMQFGK